MAAAAALIIFLLVWLSPVIANFGELTYVRHMISKIPNGLEETAVRARLGNIQFTRLHERNGVITCRLRLIKHKSRHTIGGRQYDWSAQFDDKRRLVRIDEESSSWAISE